MQESEESKVKKENLNKNRTKSSDLPWWVELLFVQIGLPESVLRNTLKLKAQAKDHIKNRRVSYYITFLLIGSISYLFPIIQESRIKNICVKETNNLLNQGIKDNKSKELTSTSLSVNHCNGGNYLSSKRSELL